MNDWLIDWERAYGFQNSLRQVVLHRPLGNLELAGVISIVKQKNKSSGTLCSIESRNHTAVSGLKTCQCRRWFSVFFKSRLKTLNTDPTSRQRLLSYDRMALYKFDYYYYLFRGVDPEGWGVLTTQYNSPSLSLHLHFNGHFPGEPGLAGVYWGKGWWRWWWQLEL